MRIVSRQEALDISGGRLEDKALPKWVDSAPFRAAQLDFGRMTDWFKCHFFKVTVDFELTNSTGLRSSLFRVGKSEYLCLVPCGLRVRIDYLGRMLEREWDKPLMNVHDPDSYGDFPDFLNSKRDTRLLPPPIDLLTREFITDRDFWDSCRELHLADERKEKSQYRHIQIDQIRQSVLFCAFHEAAHAYRHHDDIAEIVSRNEEDSRGIELDADAHAGRWLAQYRALELSGVDFDNPLAVLDAVIDSSWRLTYGMCLVLGLFDIGRLAIGLFSSDIYHHPIVRLQFAVNGMFHGFADVFGPPAVYERLVVPSGIAAIDYTDRIKKLWRRLDPFGEFRKPTSISLTLLPRIALQEPLQGPIKGLASQTLGELFRTASTTYLQFLLSHENHLRHGTAITM